MLGPWQSPERKDAHGFEKNRCPTVFVFLHAGPDHIGSNLFRFHRAGYAVNHVVVVSGRDQESRLRKDVRSSLKGEEWRLNRLLEVQVMITRPVNRTCSEKTHLFSIPVLSKLSQGETSFDQREERSGRVYSRGSLRSGFSKKRGT